MAEKLQVYKCDICGNIVEVLTGGAGDLVCCDENMLLLDEKTADSSTEKHVPVIEKVDGGYKVTVGSTLHPMTEEHHIEWIELIVGCKAYREFLCPGDAPEATFAVCGSSGCSCCGGEATAREHCNVHGLWKS